MKINNNLLYAIFWICLFTCVSISYYFDYKAVQYKTDSDIQIANMEEQTKRDLYKSYNEVYEILKKENQEVNYGE